MPSKGIGREVYVTLAERYTKPHMRLECAIGVTTLICHASKHFFDGRFVIFVFTRGVFCCDSAWNA